MLLVSRLLRQHKQLHSIFQEKTDDSVNLRGFSYHLQGLSKFSLQWQQDNKPSLLTVFPRTRAGTK